MNTRFITAEIELQASPAQMQQAIATELQTWGQPLRWAITHLDLERRKAVIEAVVTVEEETVRSVVVPMVAV